jgi:hypothetical protein
VPEPPESHPGPLEASTIRLRSDQFARLADWVLRANAELIDEARASGHRLDYRVTDSDLIRLALDEFLTHSWDDVREGARREAQRSRPGRPRTRARRQAKTEAHHEA